MKTVFRKALEVAGPRRLLFGSDSSFFPRGWHAQIYESQIQALAGLEVGGEQARLILGGNLERLLAKGVPGARCVIRKGLAQNKMDAWR